MTTEDKCTPLQTFPTNKSTARKVGVRAIIAPLLLGHSSRTVRPERDRPSWGKYPLVVSLAAEKEPLSRVSIPASSFSKVDLPVPFAPTSPTRSLAPTTQLRPSKSVLEPKCFPAEES